MPKGASHVSTSVMMMNSPIPKPMAMPAVTHLYIGEVIFGGLIKFSFVVVKRVLGAMGGSYFLYLDVCSE